MTNFTNYFAGDPYVGSRSEEMKKKNERITELEGEVKRLQRMLDNKSRMNYNNGGPAAAGPNIGQRTAVEKRARYVLQKST